MSYRSPALVGDLTYLNATVTDVQEQRNTGLPIATVEIVMTNQKDDVMASGEAEVLLPTETLPED